MPQTTKKIAETTINTFAEFVEIIEKKGKEELILFRGQQDDYDLLPKIARKNSGFNSENVE